MRKIKNLSWLIVLLGIAIIGSGCVSRYVRSAKIYMQQDDPQNAKEMLLEGAQMTPDDPEVFYLLGKVHAELKEWDDMNKAFDRAAELTDKYDKDIEATRMEAWRKVFNKAVKPFNKKDYETALKDFLVALKIRPGERETLRRIAQCYLQLDQFDKSEEYFKLALEGDKDNSDISTRINLMNMYWTEKRWDDVITMAREILAINPEQEGVIDKEALAYQQKGDDQKAKEAWDMLIAAHPDNPDYYFNRGMLDLRMENFEEAALSFGKAIELNPNDEEALNFYINALLRLERWQDLANLLEPIMFPGGEVKELDNPKDDADKWRILQAAYLNLGENDKALIVVMNLKKLGVD